MPSKPLFLVMEDAFNSALRDDCFYEWNEVAAAMLRAIADRIVETQDPAINDLDVVYWLQEEAAIAEACKDPRNSDDYDTWDVGLEPLPGDTTWAKK